MSAARIVPRSGRVISVAASLALLSAILALAWFVYRPGLSGAFLFDDLGSLPKLGATGAVDNWAAFWRYITSGSADPTGRPLTLLTFLIDGSNWPTAPYPFKVTNVILHLINGALLAGVLWWLGRVLRISPLRSGEGARRAREGSEPRGASARRFAAWLRARRSTPPFASEDGGANLPPSERRGTEGDGISARDGIPPPLRLNPLPMEGGSSDGGSGASPPPSERRAERSERARSAIEGDGSCSASTTSPRATRDPLPGEGGEKTFWPALAALFGAGAWLLHPLLVSTTLYIVQREAMLPATFVLIAMLGWMASRDALHRGHTKRALAGMAASAWLCTALAVLSKANGALLPLLLLLVEWIVLSHQPMSNEITRRWHRRAVTVFLIVPGALVIAYLLYLTPGSLSAPIDARGWTTAQRLLTEPRVLTDYLRLLFVPHAHSSGLFNDAFPVSTDWLHPVSTIPCIVLILALIGTGFALRRKHPAIALALLFYFTAQLMESGWIPLELYFEHRNYLPAMLLFWPIGIGLGVPGTLRWLRMLIAAGILAALAVLTFQRAALWGNAPRQAQVWAAINPDSARAQTSAALYDLQNDRPRLAAARLHLAMPKHPDELQIPVNLITAECRLGTVQPSTLAAARTALASDRVGGEVAFNWFGEAVVSVDRHACRGLDYATLQDLLDSAWRNSHWVQHAGLRANLLHLQGTLELAQHQPRKALHDFNLALKQVPTPNTALGQAATLGASGYPVRALAHLDYFATMQVPRKTGFSMSRIHAWVLHEQGWWPKETARLRKTLAEDAAAKVSQPADDAQ